MVRIVVAMLLVALQPSTVSAQLVRDHDGEGGVRGFHGPAGASHIRRSFQSDADARAEFERILSAVGLAWITGTATALVFATGAATASVKGNRRASAAMRRRWNRSLGIGRRVRPRRGADG